MSSEHIDDIVRFAQERIDAFYLRVASLTNHRPRFFAEKCLPQGNVPELVRELYPDAREIFLVRDFRDMYTSIRAFNRKRGTAGFGLDGATSDAVYVSDVLSPSVESLVREWRRRGDTSHIVRYEDLVCDPAATIARVLDYLGADSAPEILQGMLDRAHSEIPEMQAHRTSGSASESIGRWSRELPEDVARLCDDAFGPALRELGYRS